MPDLPPIPDDAEVVLFFDGSFAGDSTGLVAVTPAGHIEVVGHWSKPADEVNWRVDIAAVEAAILAACRRYRVRECAMDPFRWQRSMQALADVGVPVVEYPTTSPARMVAACSKFFDAVMDRKVRHNGDPTLARHLGSAVVKTDHLGPRIVKQHKDSKRHIDLAVCAVAGFDRATVAPDVVPPSVYEDRGFVIL